MFADLELARRIERAEAGLTAGIVSKVPAEDALVMEVGGGVAAFARTGSPMNKVIAVGLAGPIDDAELEAVEAAHEARREPVRVELATLVEQPVVLALSARGYGLRGFENVLGMGLDGAGVGAGAGGASGARDVTVEAVTAETVRAWEEAAIEGFTVGDGTGAVVEEHERAVVVETMNDFARCTSVRRWLARVGGEVAGIGSARLEDGIVQLCGAATLPVFRRRGVQRALLDARLAAGREAGCELAVVTTAPGSQSQANVMRRGFALLYGRAILARAARAA